MGVCGSDDNATSDFDCGVGVEEQQQHFNNLWSVYDKNSDGVLDEAETKALLLDAVRDSLLPAASLLSPMHQSCDSRDSLHAMYMCQAVHTLLLL
jgi:hypothetical protein